METNVLSNEPKTNNSTVDFPDLKKGFTYMDKDSEPKPAILEYNQGITLIIQQKNSITVDNELVNVEKKFENFQETEILEETPKTKRKNRYIPLVSKRKKSKSNEEKKFNFPKKRKKTEEEQDESEESDSDNEKETDEDLDSEEIEHEARNLSESDPEVKSVYDILCSHISKYPLLLPHEEKELSKQIQAGSEEAFNRMVLSNIRLVIACVKKIQKKNGNTSILDFMDLIQEGIIGLMIAVERFDWRKNTRFSTYGVSWMCQRIRRSISQQRVGMTVPGYAGSSVYMLKNWIDMWKEGKVEEIPKGMRKRVKDLSRIASPIVSIDSDNGEQDGEYSMYSVSSDRNLVGEDGNENLMKFFFREHAQNLFKETLEGIQYDILCRRFSLPPYLACQSLKEIGDVYHKSSEYVRMIIDKTIKELRTNPKVQDFYYNWTGEKNSSETKNK